MFKGLISLFTSGAIFNPLVMLGIVSGGWCYFNMSPDDIRTLFLRSEFYAVVAIVSTAFVFCFKKRFKDNGNHLDLGTMFLSIVAGIFKFFLSFILVVSFISMLSVF